MATNFPQNLDNFADPRPDDATNTPAVRHASQHDDENDAIEALEVKVGVDGSAVTSSLDYKINHLMAGGGSGGPVSLSGPGETTTPGALTQAGGFTVSDTAGDGILLNSVGGTAGVQLANTGTNGIGLTDSSGAAGGISLLELDLAGTINLQCQAGALATGGIDIQSEGTGGINIHTGVGAGDVVVHSDNGGVYLSTFGTGEIVLSSTTLGFFNATSVVKPTVSGSRGANAALASELSALAALGLVVDSTTAGTAPPSGGYVALTTTGNTWTVPAGVTMVRVVARAGGNGGGGGGSALVSGGTSNQAGGGGGAAGQVIDVLLPVTAGHVMTATIGTGGAGGSGGAANGHNGGFATAGTATQLVDTTASTTVVYADAFSGTGFPSLANSTVQGLGGCYAQGSTSQNNGTNAVPAGSGGVLNDGIGPVGPVVGGQGGGVAGTTIGGAGGHAQQAGVALRQQFQGANSLTSSGVAGDTATEPGCGGGGGGGGGSSSGAGGAGGAGAPGLIELWWT